MKLLITICLLWAGTVEARERFIVKFKKSVRAKKNLLGLKRAKSDRFQVFKSKELLKKFQDEHSDQIEMVEEDAILKKFDIPNDPLVESQWHYFDEGGINLENISDFALSGNTNIVAVIDTGIVRHQDINSKIIGGYDFISDTEIAGDGNDRDENFLDEGDWISEDDSCFTGSERPSSWHGTHVAGTIAANTDNGIGVAGVSKSANIIVGRVLGKCGGYTSDIADAIRWSAGGSVEGVPENMNPAKVINLSLGGVGPCSSYMQDAINFANSKKVTIVVAAGNSGQNMDISSVTPANCNGVIVVGASNRESEKSFYSNYGLVIDVLAPGGDGASQVLSLGNDGEDRPGNDSYTFMMGTSMAAPHVAGIASLILSANPDLYPHQVEEILKKSARNMDSGSDCDETLCGAGIVDAYEAVLIAVQMDPEAPDENGVEPITPDAPGSDNGGNAGEPDVTDYRSTPNEVENCGVFRAKQDNFGFIISVMIFPILLSLRKNPYKC